MWACLGGQLSGGDHVGVRWTHVVASVSGNAGADSGHGEQGWARSGFDASLLCGARGCVWQVQWCARGECDMVAGAGEGDIELDQGVAKLARAWTCLDWHELPLAPL